jgi:hypothetical protein
MVSTLHVPVHATLACSKTGEYQSKHSYQSGGTDPLAAPGKKKVWKWKTRIRLSHTGEEEEMSPFQEKCCPYKKKKR